MVEILIFYRSWSRSRSRWKNTRSRSKEDRLRNTGTENDWFLWTTGTVLLNPDPNKINTDPKDWLHKTTMRLLTYPGSSCELLGPTDRRPAPGRAMPSRMIWKKGNGNISIQPSFLYHKRKTSLALPCREGGGATFLWIYFYFFIFFFFFLGGG